MNAKNLRPKRQNVVAIHQLDNYRNPPTPARDATARQHAKRIELVRKHVLDRLEDQAAPALAVAAAFVDANGNLGIAAAGIEPEMAASLSHHLRSLADTLDEHAASVRRHSKRQRGTNTLMLTTAIGFMAATYINDIAWVDAALSLAAQLVAATFRHPKNH